MRHLVGVVLGFVLAFGITQRAAAQAAPEALVGPTTFSLELAPSECATTDAQLAAAIVLRVPSAQRVETAAEVAVHAEISNGGTSALQVTLKQGSSRREFQGASCDEAVTLIAFIAALVLDARPEERLQATELASVPDTTPPPDPGVKVKPTAQPSAHASPLAAIADRSQPEQASTKARFGLSAALALETAVAPTPPPAGLVGVNVRWQRPSWFSPELRAELLVTGTATKVTNPGELRLHLTTGRLSACPVARRALAFQLAACATFDAGWLHGQGSSTIDGFPNGLLWLAGGASVLAEVPVTTSLELELQLGVKLLANHNNFTLEPNATVAYAVPLVSGGFAVGMGFRP